jgi:hypothetical protein
MDMKKTPSKWIAVAKEPKKSLTARQIAWDALNTAFDKHKAISIQLSHNVVARCYIGRLSYHADGTPEFEFYSHEWPRVQRKRGK